jgi:hypothetical protein
MTSDFVSQGDFEHVEHQVKRLSDEVLELIRKQERLTKNADRTIDNVGKLVDVILELHPSLKERLSKFKTKGEPIPQIEQPPSKKCKKEEEPAFVSEVPVEMPFEQLIDSGETLRNIPHSRWIAWEKFRIEMPYGCMYDERKKRVFYFNREYKRLGVSKQQSRWTNYPDYLYDRVYFYEDYTKPLSTEAAQKAYVEGLALFKDYTTIRCAEEDVVPYFDRYGPWF